MDMLRKFSMLSRVLIWPVLCAGLAGCAATSPINLEQPPSTISVTDVRASITDSDTSSSVTEGDVLWGGTVLNVSNLADSTQVEIMAHPLDHRQRPITSRKAQGRFVASFEGFVEPLTFPPGRVVTLLGSLREPVRGTVGEAVYVYPVIAVIDSHLWTAQELAPRSGVSFGIGISLGN